MAEILEKEQILLVCHEDHCLNDDLLLVKSRDAHRLHLSDGRIEQVSE